MLYLSAQPDQIYFIWQLEIQLRNLSALGIPKENIQVLVAFNKEKGLNPLFQKFIDVNCHIAQIYCYPDIRIESKYTSSIRPNILRQHFEVFPELDQETIFYHDSDILFSRIPQIEEVETNDICYVSDTRNYLDVNYICRTSSEELLDNMVAIVGLEKDKLLQENSQTGGAQYILKNVNATFWEKVERDSEELYVLMKQYNQDLWEREYPDKKDYKSAKRGIQAWCSDMWAVLWNLWYLNKRVEIHPEMDFSWPYSPIEEWQSKAIQHYSGKIEEKEKFFKKGEYLNFMPWYDNSLLSISSTNCSYKIVELIQNRKLELDNLRPVYDGVVLVFNGIESSNNLLSNFELISNYIKKYLAIDIVLLVNEEPLSNNVDVFSFSQLQNLIQEYKRIVYFSDVFLLNIDDIQNILLVDDEKNRKHIISDIYQIDSLFSEAFFKILDIDLLEKNKGKFNISKREEYVTIITSSNITTQLIVESSTSSIEFENNIIIPSVYLLK